MKRYNDVKEIAEELNGIKIPLEPIKAKDIIKKSIKVEEKKIHRVRNIRVRRVAACFVMIMMTGIIVYTTGILQTNIKITKDGFVVGQYNRGTIPENSDRIFAEVTEEITEEVSVVEDGEENKVFFDLESTYSESDMPHVLPSMITKDYKLSDKGIVYYTFKAGNLVQKQWKVAYGNEDREVAVYLDYAKWEGEPNNRVGAEFGYGKKVKKKRAYTSPSGIRFEMAKVTEYDGTQSTMAVVAVRNYYYVLLFRNLEKAEVQEILDTVDLSDLSK